MEYESGDSGRGADSDNFQGVVACLCVVLLDGKQTKVGLDFGEFQSHLEVAF